MRHKRYITPVLLFLVSLTQHSVAVCQTDSPSAQFIMERMAAQYADASSYEDVGVIETVNGDGSNRRQVDSFKTYFTRPQFFRFEWTNRSRYPEDETVNVIWCNGEQTYSSYSWHNEPEREENLSLGIAGATGISRGSAHLIPVLLLESVSGFSLTQTTNQTLLREEQFEGEECYVVRGYHPYNFPIDMWISKADFLLRKVREPKDDGTYEEDIRRNVRTNGNIPREMFNYVPPPKPRRRNCSLAVILLAGLFISLKR